MAGRVEKGRLLLDLRSVDPDDDDRLIAAILAVAAPDDPSSPECRALTRRDIPGYS